MHRPSVVCGHLGIVKTVRRGVRCLEMRYSRVVTVVEIRKSTVNRVQKRFIAKRITVTAIEAKHKC